jgi:hypothetical protein
MAVRISNKFIADLKRIAELDNKMTEYDELGRLMKLRKEREKLIPKVAVFFLKKWYTMETVFEPL